MLTKKERDKAAPVYKEMYTEFVEGNRLIPENYSEQISGFLMSEYMTTKIGLEGYEKAQRGDFSLFETVDPVFRNWMASEFERNAELFPREIKTNLEEGNIGPAEKQFLDEHKKNPVFRLYCSLKSRENEKFRDYDDMMVDMIMEDTMRPMTEDQINKVHEMTKTPEEAQEMIAANVEKQVQMAKMMFLTHFGKTNLVNKANEKIEMDRSVASMMAHCSRTAFVFSSGDQKSVDEMMGHLVGAKKGKAAGVFSRFAATHTTRQGKTISEFKEVKKASFRHQYGMNVAIGGLGNPGISGPNGPQTLKTDGSCGHMYMRVDKGGPDKTSSLLVGFESDAPGVNNQQGHGHSAAANGEFMSSFLAQREDEMGEKYGGRIVDCTGIQPAALSKVLERFTGHYRTMLYGAMGYPIKGYELGKGAETIDPATARLRLEDTNRMLLGKLMDTSRLEVCMNNTGMTLEDANIAAKFSANARDLDYDLPARTNGQKHVEPMFAPEKPSKRVRFKAFIGDTYAKKLVNDYKAAKAERKAATKKVAMSFNEFSKEAAKDSPAKKKVAMKKTPENVLANEAAKKAKGRTGMK